MKFGLAREKITPSQPVYMAGYGARTEPSEGIHDDIYVRTALIEADKTLLIIALDATGGDRGFVLGIQETLSEKFGLRPDEVLINFSHTHSSIDLTGPVADKDMSGYGDESFYFFVRDAIVRAVERCSAHLQTGRLLLGRGKSDTAISRRKMTDQGLKWQPNPDAETDKEVFVIKLLDKEDAVKGILFGIGCHPTALSFDNRWISAEFPGAACDYLEKLYPGASAMFLQACGGELKPSVSADGDRFKSCTFEEMETAGRTLGADVAHIMEDAEFAAVGCRFRTALVEAYIYTEQTGIEHYERIVNESGDGFRGEAATETIRKIKDGTIADRIPMYIEIWHLDEHTRLITMEGEIPSGYSLMIKELFTNGRTIVLGYSNGVHCYIPTRKMLDEGGYETESNYFFGNLRGPFIPEIEDIILGRIARTDSLLSRS